MSLAEKEAWAALRRGYLRDVMGQYFDIMFINEPDINEKGQWECEVQRMRQHGNMGMVPDEAHEPVKIKIYKSQLGDLKDDFYGNTPPWSIKMVYRVSTAPATYTKRDGTEGTSHRMKVASKLDIGQRTLPPVPPPGGNNQPAAAENTPTAAGTPEPIGPPKPTASVSNEPVSLGDRESLGSGRGQPGPGAPCTHPHGDRIYSDDTHYRCTICNQQVVVIP